MSKTAKSLRANPSHYTVTQRALAATAKAGAQYGVSERLVELAKKVLDNGIPDLVRAVEEGDTSISDAAKRGERVARGAAASR
jgi:hypothetical protein